MMPTDTQSNRRSLVLLAALAGVFLFFGIGQFQVLQHHKKIASESDRLLFKFSTIREFITGALLEERYGDLSAAAGELESFGDHVADILKNPLIPDSYKAGLIRQADLPGTVLLVRQISGSGGQGKISQLNERIRQLGDQLLLFDRMISSHIKKKVVGYQSLVIGVLVIVLVVLGNFSFFHYRDVIRPLIHFRREMGPAAADGGDQAGSGSGWIAALCRRVRMMAQHDADSQAELERLRALVQEGHGAGQAMIQMGRLSLVGQMASGVCHEVNDAANCIINHSQLCLDEIGDCANAEGLRVMLRRLLDDGERVAALAGQFLKVSQDRDAAGPTAAPERVIAEISSLVVGQFRQDGIRFSGAAKSPLAAIACPPPVFRLLCLQFVLLGRTWLKQQYASSGATTDNLLIELVCGEEHDTGSDGFSLLTIRWSSDPGAMSGLSGPTEKSAGRIEEGMTLCRAIIESEHGNMAVDRARPGTVTVLCRLPLADGLLRPE